MGLMSVGGGGSVKGLCILTQFKYNTADDRVIYIASEYITNSDDYNFTFQKNCKVHLTGYQRVAGGGSFKFTYDGTDVVNVSSSSGSGRMDVTFEAKAGKSLVITGYNGRNFAYALYLE